MCHLYHNNTEVHWTLWVSWDPSSEIIDDDGNGDDDDDGDVLWMYGGLTPFESSGKG